MRVSEFDFMPSTRGFDTGFFCRIDAAMMRVGAVMGKSAHIMKTMNALVNGPAVTETM